MCFAIKILVAVLFLNKYVDTAFRESSTFGVEFFSKSIFTYITLSITHKVAYYGVYYAPIFIQAGNQ